MSSIIFVHAIKRLIYSNRTVTIKCLSSVNFYAITYIAFSNSYWNVHVYYILLAVAVSTVCITTIAVWPEILAVVIFGKSVLYISCIIKYWAV